jgi:hypothetical protein
MPIQVQGNGGVVAEVDGTTFRAQRITPRPVEYGALGHYSYGGFTGIIPAALAANSEIFQFRWTDATRLCVINEIVLSAAVSTTFFAAGVPIQIDLVKATGWSAQGTGGPTIAPAALLKKRTSMGSSLVASGDIRIAATAALGAGTKTLEGLSLAAILASGPITASLDGTFFPPGTTLWHAEVGNAEHPLVLAQNEGFVIRSVAVPATGTWTAAITVDWAEVVAY